MNELDLNKQQKMHNKILLTVLSCENITCSQKCRDFTKNLSRCGVYFVEKNVNCTDNESIVSAYSNPMCFDANDVAVHNGNTKRTDLIPRLNSTGSKCIDDPIYEFFTPVYVSVDLNVISVLLRIIIDTVSSSYKTDGSRYRRVKPTVFHVDNTEYSLYEYLNFLKTLTTLDARSYTLDQKTPKISSLIDHLDSIDDKIVKNTSTDNPLFKQLVSRRLIEKILSVDQIGCNDGVTPLQRVTNSVSCSFSASDLLSDLKILDYSVCSYREITSLLSKAHHKTSISIVINCSSQSELTTVEKEECISLLKDAILNINPMINDVFISVLKFVLLYRNVKDVENYVKIIMEGNTQIRSKRICIEMYDVLDDDDDNEIKRYSAYINDVLPKDGVINVDKVSWWYSLYKYQNIVEFTGFSSNIVMIADLSCANKLMLNGKLVFDIADLLKTTVSDVNNKIESISLMDDVFILGTKRVMLYFMLLYSYIGSYKPWKNIRRFETNGVTSSDDYYLTPKRLYLDPDVQMTEHILHFTDLVETRIHKIKVPEKKDKIIIVYKNEKVNTQLVTNLKGFCLRNVEVVNVNDVVNINDVLNFFSDANILFWNVPITDIESTLLALLDVFGCSSMPNTIAVFREPILIDNTVGILEAELPNVDKIIVLKDKTVDDIDYSIDNINEAHNSNDVATRLRIRKDPYDVFNDTIADPPNNSLRYTRNDGTEVNDYDIVFVLDDNHIEKIDMTTLITFYDVCTSNRLRVRVVRITNDIDDNFRDVDDFTISNASDDVGTDNRNYDADCFLESDKNDLNQKLKYMEQIFGQDFQKLPFSKDTYSVLAHYIDKCKCVCTHIQDLLIYSAGVYRLLLSLDKVCSVSTTSIFSKCSVVLKGSNSDPGTKQTSVVQLRNFVNEINTDTYFEKYKIQLHDAYTHYKKFTWYSFINEIIG